MGIDVASVSDVRDSLREFGERYLRRIFTAREVADCYSSADPVPRLAARFAAKEATIKALKVDGAQPAWRSLEVWRHPLGWCDMRLTGAAARLAARRAIGGLSVSLSHEDDVAIAVVVATTGSGRVRFSDEQIADAFQPLIRSSPRIGDGRRHQGRHLVDRP